MSVTRRSLLGSAAASLAFVPVVARQAFAQTASSDGFRTIEARTGQLKLGDGAAEVDIVGIDGIVPGPVLRVKLGEEAKFRLVNKLDVPTALHWRGVRLANAMDGTVLTQAAVAAAGQFDYRFTPPDAGTFLYQASATAQAGARQARGLSGIFIVEERSPPAVDQDLVLALDDWPAASPKRETSDAAEKKLEKAPPLITLNGKLAPATITAQPGARLRLRLANLSTQRIMLAGFDGVKPLVIAVDGQPCDPFEPVRWTVPIGPGARFDLICDMPKVPGDCAMVLRSESDLRLATFKIDGEPVAEKTAFAGLVANPALPNAIALEKASRADLVIEPAALGKDNAKTDAVPGWTINGIAGSPEGKPLVSVKRGTAISFGFINKTSVLQPIHVHGHVVRQLHLLDDGWEPYWRDSVIVPPGKTVRVAFVADNPGRWMVELALPDWAGAGLWGWFEVK